MHGAKILESVRCVVPDEYGAPWNFQFVRISGYAQGGVWAPDAFPPLNLTQPWKCFIAPLGSAVALTA